MQIIELYKYYVYIVWKVFCQWQKNLIKIISEIFLSNIILFNNQDAIVNQLKIETMIFINLSFKNLKAEKKKTEKLKLNKNIFDIELNFIGKN